MDFGRVSRAASVRRMVFRPLRLAALAAGLSAGLSACANIWGFEPGADLPGADAGVTATSDATGPGSERDANGVDSGNGNDDASREAIEAQTPFEAGPDAPSGIDAAADAGRACAFASLCVPQAPAGGWQGPYAIIESSGSPLPSLPNCPAGSYSQDVYDGKGTPVAAPANCACNCGPAEGVACSAPSLNYVSTKNSCGTCSPAVAPDSLAGPCTQLHTAGRCDAVSIGSAVPEGGACKPNSSSTVPPQSWTTEARLCALPSAPPVAGCAAGEVCAPATGLPVESATYCVAIAGASACPAAYYTAARQYYWGGDDTRGCTACSCGKATGATCNSAALVTYTDTSCTQVQDTPPVPAVCSNLNSTGIVSAVSFAGGAPSGGSCVADGGQPTGAFAPTTPYTICCNQ